MTNLAKIKKYGDKAITTLKEASFDSINNEYMTDSAIKVYNFDKIKDEYIKENFNKCIAEDFKSNDALYYNNEKFFFIEFKNGCIEKQSEKEKLRSKIAESLLILTDILQENLNFTRQNCSYILVYNKKKNTKLEKKKNSSKTAIGKNLSKKAKQEHSIVPMFKKYILFFKAIHTVNNEEFTQLLESLT